MKLIELVLIVVLTVVIIFFVRFVVFGESPPSPEPFYAAEQQVRFAYVSAYANPGVTGVYSAKTAFMSGMVFNASSIIEEEIPATLTFECSTEIANACTLEENGKILKINDNFNVQTSACCVDTYTEPKCIVKLGEETARC